MARQEFLDNLRIAYRSLASERVTGDVIDTSIAEALTSANLWLTSRAVKGFRAADFADLPQADLRALRHSVQRFRAITSQVPRNRPATKGQAKSARQYLQRILEIVGRQ